MRVSFDKGQQVEDETHINALWLAKTQAKLSPRTGSIKRLASDAGIPTLLQQSI